MIDKNKLAQTLAEKINDEIIDQLLTAYFSVAEDSIINSDELDLDFEDDIREIIIEELKNLETKE